MGHYINRSTQSAIVKVLIISDELETARIWESSLRHAGLSVRLTGVTEDALSVWDEEHPDVIILNHSSQQGVEIELCRKLRRVCFVPILYFTSHQDDSHLLEVYSAGADECAVFPIPPSLFQAKIHAWLRWTRSIPVNALAEIHAGSFSLIAGKKLLVLPSGELVHLTMLETRLLYLLMTHANTPLDTDQITTSVWGYNNDCDSSLLKNLVYRLRKKIEPNPNLPQYLVTAGSSGYTFIF